MWFFSKCRPMALSSQPSSVWVVICMKCSVLSCLSLLVCWLSDNDAADAWAVRRVHIRLKRKWEVWWLLMEPVSEVLETILVMGDWTGKEPIKHKWHIRYFVTFCKKGGHNTAHWPVHCICKIIKVNWFPVDINFCYCHWKYTYKTRSQK